MTTLYVTFRVVVADQADHWRAFQTGGASRDLVMPRHVLDDQIVDRVCREVLDAALVDFDACGEGQE